MLFCSNAQSRSKLQLCLIAACAWRGLAAPPGDFEIEFVPGDTNTQEGPVPLLEMLAAQAAGDGSKGDTKMGASTLRGSGHGNREAELDNMLANVFGPMLRSDGRAAPQRGGMPFSTVPQDGVAEEIVFEGPTGTQVMTMDGAGGMMGSSSTQVSAKGGQASLPDALLQGLFPHGPVHGDTSLSSYSKIAPGCVTGSNIKIHHGKSLEECVFICNSDPDCKAFEYGVPHFGDSSKYEPHDCIPNTGADPNGCNGDFYNLDLYVKPSLGPDALIADMLQDLDRSFAQQMMPAIKNAAGQEFGACTEDVKKSCAGAKSHLHCLGMNHETISEACRTEVGKSVPFTCSTSIDRFCDVLQKGILSCLYDHMQDLDGACRDAVLATQHVINNAKSQQASPAQPPLGITKASTPDKEAHLDAKLGLASIPDKEAHLDAKLGLAQASPAEPIPKSGWLRELSRFVIVALLALVAYLFVFTDVGKSLQSQLLRGQDLESAKLLSGSHLELPRPEAM